MYKLSTVPPLGLTTVAVPSLAPLQVTLVCDVVAVIADKGCVIVTEGVIWQPLTSVMVQV